MTVYDVLNSFKTMYLHFTGVNERILFLNSPKVIDIIPVLIEILLVFSIFLSVRGFKRKNK
ncbi:MAG TPA: hypothetical protein DCK76_12055 [Desulfotomaculum sp.]|nr:MAG: hypothetical protein XD84_1852 [Desulfotomaculum sp. 46_80]HAG12070.1 hypothetical protein [Desulfotomaculum sp.]HBY02957.1 hypothetical protein [Desulfotomaculum sp.]